MIIFSPIAIFVPPGNEIETKLSTRRLAKEIKPLRFLLGGWRDDLYNNSARKGVAQFTLALVHVGSEISLLKVSRRNLSSWKKNMRNHVTLSGEREKERGTQSWKIRLFTPQRGKELSQKTVLIYHFIPLPLRRSQFPDYKLFPQELRYLRDSVFIKWDEKLLPTSKTSIYRPTLKKIIVQG